MPNREKNKSLDKNELLRAYKMMKSIRVFEERVAREFELGNIPGFVHMYAGQEAVATGACMHLDSNDYIGSTHRGHGHCIAKGCDVKGMMKEIMGKDTGLCRGKGGSMHIADMDQGMLGANAIVGGSPPLCVGAALSAKTLKNKGVSVAFSGDGASNQGTVFESMNLAVVLQLPVLFIFENNGYGEATSVDYAVGSKDIASRAAAFGMPAEKVDGLDFFAVYEAMKTAIERARNGGGPTTLEVNITRFGGHFVGDPQLYRAPGEVDKFKKEMDCLKYFEDQVIKNEWLTENQLAVVDDEVDTLIEEAVSEGLAALKPTPDALMKDVYINY